MKINNIFKTIGFLILLLNFTNLKALDITDPDIQKILQEDSEIYSQGIYLYQQGQYKASLPYVLKSFSIRKKILKEEYDINLASSYNVLSELYRLTKDYSKALKYSNKLLTVYEKNVKIENMYTAIAYDNRGLIYSNMEEYSKALPYYKKALKIFKKLLGENHIDTCKAYNNQGVLYRKIKQYKKALDYNTKALIIAKKIQNTKEILANYRNIGMIYVDKKQYNQAFIFFEKALELSKKENNLEYIILGNNDLADIYNFQEKPLKALSYFKKLLKIREKYLGFHIDTAMTYHDIGLIYITLAEYTEALDFQLKALRIREKLLGVDINTAKTYNNIGIIYSSLGDYQTAIEYFIGALNMFRKTLDTEEHSLIATVYSNIASNYDSMRDIVIEDGIDKSDIDNRMKNISRALLFYNKAINIGEKIDDELIGITYTKLARILRNTGNYEQSLEYYNKALQANKRIWGEKGLNTIETYADLGVYYTLVKDFKKAFYYINKALALRKNIFPSTHLKMIDSYNHLSLYYFHNKKYDQAYKYSFKVFNLSSKRKNKIFSTLNNNRKEKYLKSKRAYIFNLLFSTNAFNTITSRKKTINSWLKYKGSIFDSQNSISTLYINTKDQVLKEKIEILTSNQRALANLYQNIGIDQERWKEKIEEKEKKITKLTNEIAKKSSISQEQQGLKFIDYKVISKNLKKNELYIDYAKDKDSYYIFTLDKQEEIGFIQIDINSTKKIDSLITTFRKDVQSINAKKLKGKNLERLTQSSKEKLAQLYELLIKNPLKDKLEGKSSLIISPDGALRLLPFETLYDKEKQEYLVQSREIRYVPSGKELVRLYEYAKDRVAIKNKTVVFANPNFDSNETVIYHEQMALTRGTDENIIKPFFQTLYDPLLGTKLEAEAIKRTMNNVEVFEWNRANETNLLNVEEPKILHIATHGFFINAPNIPNPMLKSGIILSGANKSARNKEGYGRVTALKLSGLNLKSTDLVVLSACETGVVDINNTDSISGLGKAFIQAGAKDVVMSLWSVDDNATKNLMVSFYEQIKEKPNYALVLKKAKLKMIAEDMHPFYWGGFVVLGL